MCKMVGVSRDSYYKRNKRENKKLESDSVVLNLVKEVRREEPRVGCRKLYHKASEAGIKVGRDRLFNILRENQLLVQRKKRFQKTTYSQHQYAVAQNVFKDAHISGSNQAFVSDITFITLRKGFAYLFLVTDAYSRKVVGWHLSKDLSHYSALLALDQAITNIDDPSGLIHHSDRGVQYCCHSFLQYLSENGITPSMTDSSHCYQNAIAERVNGILKDEFNLDAVFDSFSEALTATGRAIIIYNTKRIHWSLKLKTPEQVYALAA